MAKNESRATARLVDANCRSTVELSVPVGIRFEDLLANTDWLVDTFTKFRPRGCEACLSGRDLVIREMFDDVVNVEFRG